MKGVLGYLLFGLAAYLVFLAAQVPADWAYARVAPRLDLPVRLYQLEGTIWRGTARQVLWNERRLTNLSWSLRPQALLLGRLELDLHLAHGGARIETRAGRAWDGSLYLRAGRARLPLADLEPLVSREPMGLAGTLAVTLEKLAIEGGRITELQGTALIEDAGLAPPIDVTVGDFQVEFTSDAQGVIEARLRDRGGPLQAQGLLQIQPDGNYRLTAELTARDPRRTDLRQALSYLGTPGPEGKVSLVRTGRVPFF